MVMISDLLIMIGLPVLLFIAHRLWPEAVESRKPLILAVLGTWFVYTFFGSRLLHGGGENSENIRFVVFSACVIGAAGAVMFLVIKKFPDQVKKHDTAFRMGFAAIAAVAALVGWRLFQ